MSDIDYQRLFENGQLVFAEPHHRDILDRMWQAHVGQPQEQIFRNKYQDYLKECHPELFALPEPAVPIIPLYAPVPEVPELQETVVVEPVAAAEATAPEVPAEPEASPKKKKSRAISPTL